jgi:predicted CopG family antitoxin
MGSKSIVERLRNCAEKRVFSVGLLTDAADRIEELEELVEDQIRIRAMFNNRKGRKRYIDYWRKKNGKSDLTYPDADEVYQEFWELKDSFGRIIERLEEKTKQTWLVLAERNGYSRAIEIVKEEGGIE